MSKQKKKGLVPELRFPGFEGEWEEKAFDELLTIGNGRDYKHLSRGNVPVYGSGGYMLSVNDYLYDGESVCIGRKGTINNPMFLTGKFWTVDTLFYTHSFKNCLPRFIYSIFQNIDWLKHNEAGGVPSLSKTNIGKIQVAVPKLKEQSHIADCLSSVDELISAGVQKLDALKEHKKGLMQGLFPTAGETVPKLRFPGFEGEWEENTLGGVGEIITGKTPSTSDASLWNGEIQFVTPTDISEEKYQWKTQRNVSNHAVAKILPKYSTMFTCIASIGKMALSVKPCITNQQINSIVPNKDYVNEFIYYSLLSIVPLIKSTQSNSTLPIINKTDFSKFTIPVPKEFGEQSRIADCLSSLDELISAQAEKVEALKLHKKGLMQGLFPAVGEVEG